MERLTQKFFNYCETCAANGVTCQEDVRNEIGVCGIAKIYTRLAAYEDSDLTPEEVATLSKAKQDGRLVELPCKVGDTVYDIYGSAFEPEGSVYETKVLSVLIDKRGIHVRTVSSFPDSEEFGKRIFLTIEEAKAALKKQT